VSIRAAVTRGLGVLRAGAISAALLVLPASAAPRDVALPSAAADHYAPVFPAALTLAQGTSWLENALSLRTAALDTLSNSVGSVTNLTASDRSALAGLVQGAASGISALSQKVPTDTTVAQLHQDAVAMIGYHVLSLLTPQVTRVVAIDSQLASYHSLLQQVTVLEAAITAAQQAKRNVSQPKSEDVELRQHLNDVNSQLSGLTASLLALSPASWPAPENVLKNASRSTSVAAHDLSVANGDVTEIVSQLAHPAPRTSSLRQALDALKRAIEPTV
jgi:hypothetical protein